MACNLLNVLSIYRYNYEAYIKELIKSYEKQHWITVDLQVISQCILSEFISLAFKNIEVNFNPHTRMFARTYHHHLFMSWPVLDLLLGQVTGVNVVGLLKGRYFNTKDDSVAAIAAHYDTMRDTPGIMID